MTLTSHAITGAAVATLAPQNPVLAFAFGFLSHFLLDAFPHGHYKLLSHTSHPEDRLKEDMVYGKAFVLDLLKIGVDISLGAILVYFLFMTGGKPEAMAIAFGALGGVLPDALQFVYWKIRREPLISLQKFHIGVHATKKFDGNTRKTALIEISAIVVAILFVQFTSL